MTDALTHRRRASSRECVPDRRWTCDACWTSRITIRLYVIIMHVPIACRHVPGYIDVYDTRLFIEYTAKPDRSRRGPLTLRETSHVTASQRRPDPGTRGLRTITVAEHAADALFVAAPCPSTPRRGPTPRTEVCARQFAVVRQASSSTARTPNAEAPICRFLTRDVVRREPLGPASLDLPGDAWRYDPPAVYFGLMRSSHTR